MSDPSNYTYTPAETLTASEIHRQVTAAVDRARTLVDDPSAPSMSIGRLNHAVSELADAVETLLTAVVRS